MFGLDPSTVNARCPAALLDEICELDSNGRHLLERAANANGLSARGYHRTLRLARTIADLDGSRTIGVLQLAEALSLRGGSLAAQRAA
jgi:magnesium chelatase family protein